MLTLPDANTNPTQNLTFSTSSLSSCPVNDAEGISLIVRLHMYMVLEALPQLTQGAIAILSFVVLGTLGKLNRVVSINITAGLVFAAAGCVLIATAFDGNYCAVVDQAVFTPTIFAYTCTFNFGILLLLIYIYLRSLSLMSQKRKYLSWFFKVLLFLQILAITAFYMLSATYGLTWKRSNLENYYSLNLATRERNQVFFELAMGFTVLFDLSCSLVIILRIKSELRQSNGHGSQIVKLVLRNSEVRLLGGLILGITNVVINLGYASFMEFLTDSISAFLIAGQWAIYVIDSLILLLARPQNIVFFTPESTVNEHQRGSNQNSVTLPPFKPPRSAGGELVANRSKETLESITTSSTLRDSKQPGRIKVFLEDLEILPDSPPSRTTNVVSNMLDFGELEGGPRQSEIEGFGRRGKENRGSKEI